MAQHQRHQLPPLAPGALQRFRSRHYRLGDGVPTVSVPKIREPSGSSDTTPREPSKLRQSRGSSDPESPSGDEGQQAAPRDPPRRRPPLHRSRQSHSLSSECINASTAETDHQAGDLDGAAETEATSGRNGLQNPDNDSWDIDTLIASLEEDDQDAEQTQRALNADTDSDYVAPDDWLGTNVDQGLSNAEAASRRRVCGYNQLSEEKDRPWLRWLLYFHGPIQYVMFLTALLAGARKHWIDIGVIFALIILNSTVAGWQEGHARNIVKELDKTMEMSARVLRDGTFQDLKKKFVVPGDIIEVEEGSVVPADARIVLEDGHLQVDQSAMTGESLAKAMYHGDTCFSTSLVRRGKTLLLVTAIGDQTKIGRIAALVRKAGEGTGHFRQVLNGMVIVILITVFLTLFVVWTVGYYRSLPMDRLLDYTLIVAITGVPVGLPTVVTTTLTVGSSYLARKRASVKRLSAIEALAGVEVLCTDKTGTLTRNRLTAGEPYTIMGVSAETLMLHACLAANRKPKGLEPIDRAFLKALRNYPMVREALGRCKVIDFLPFDPVSKKVTAVCDIPEGSILRARHQSKQSYEKQIQKFADRGFRTIGVAVKREDGSWELLGLVPCTDPLRHDSAQTIQEARALGLRIKMLTGDAVGIAKETARQIGMGTNIYPADSVVAASSGSSTASAREGIVDIADGFAEVFPEHKHQVVTTLQGRGYLVAMTGDGVNDAASLKKADAGIAVDGSSEAAMAAADIIFRAPGLSAIIDAIKTSREIFHRIQAYIVYRIALTIHLQLFFGLLMAISHMVIAIELIVFIALFADIATLSVAYDKAYYTQSPSKWNLPSLWGKAVILGIVLAGGSALCLGSMIKSPTSWGIKGSEYGPILYLEIVLTQNWLIFITRARGAIWSSGWPSIQLLAAVLAVDVLTSVWVAFGWFFGYRSHVETILRVWIFSFGIFGIMATLFWILHGNSCFDALMRGHRRRTFKLFQEHEDIATGVQQIGRMQQELSRGTGSGPALDIRDREQRPQSGTTHDGQTNSYGAVHREATQVQDVVDG